MGKIAYFDCFAGAAGDMILAACIDAGVEVSWLTEQLQTLPIDPYVIDIQKVTRSRLACTALQVNLDHTPHAHRHLSHILQIIDAATFSPTAKERAKVIFTRLAEAEAQVHNTSIEKVHFHEVGAVDAIVDICGAALALDFLQVDRVVCSAFAVGSGTVRCEHGELPVPAPATANLLRGWPTRDSALTGELLTPTGAAILTTVAECCGPMPAMTIERIGYGAGQRDPAEQPNALRLVLGTSAGSIDQADSDTIVLLQTNIDDASPEVLGHVFDRLMAAGALDVYTTAITMKKQRPATELSVLATTDTVDTLEDMLFTETATFGVRRSMWQRSRLRRRHETVQTRFGTIRIKVGLRGERIVAYSCEYDDCRNAAEQNNVPLRVVQEEAIHVYRQTQPTWHQQ